MYIAIKQQFLFEHAKFLLQHVQPKKIISILKECIGLGELSGLNSDIHTEATKILESINIQNTTLSEVAFTTSSNSL